MWTTASDVTDNPLIPTVKRTVSNFILTATIEHYSNLQNMSFILPFTERHLSNWMYLRNVEMCLEWNSLCHAMPFSDLMDWANMDRNFVCSFHSFLYEIFTLVILTFINQPVAWKIPVLKIRGLNDEYVHKHQASRGV